MILKLSLVESESASLSVMSDSLQPHGLYSPWNSPGQNTGVGSLSLLQGIFPIQRSNPRLLHCRWILYQLSHKGSPRILEWVAYSFSSGSSQPRNWTRVSCISSGFFTSWATREALIVPEVTIKSLLNLSYSLSSMSGSGPTSFHTWGCSVFTRPFLVEDVLSPVYILALLL